MTTPTNSATAEAVPAPAIPPKGTLKAGLSRRFGPYIGVGSVLLLLLVIQAVAQPTFFDAANLTNVGRELAVPLVLASVMTLALLTGGVDLSIGATLALSGTLYAKLYTSGMPPVLALLLCILFGGALGFVINGLLIGRLNMSFFVVTLGTLSLFRGLTFLWTDQHTIDMYDDRLSGLLGNDAILNDSVPVGLLVAIAVAFLLWIVLRFTTFGRQIYATGGNREAAKLSGVRTDWVIASVYGICGLGAALAALMMIGRSTSLEPNIGTSLELTAAAAVLLGGVALSGGVGSIWNAVLGAVFLVVLSNALALAGASTSWQQIVTGLILILAVYLDRVRSRAARS